MNWIDFHSAAIGAFAGSSIAIIATLISHWLQKRWHKQYEADNLKSLMQAIHDEIETLWGLYMEGAGKRLEALEKDKPLNFYYPVTQDYFTVYTSNADSIGNINNNDLRKLIVTTYSTARGLIDSYRLNNNFVQKHENAYWIYKETNSQFHEQMASGHYKALVSYADVLRADHDNLKAKVTELLRALHKQGVLWEVCAQ